jgi:hypothetical protein
LAEIACGDFGGHYFVNRGQKARLLPAAPAEPPFAAISADITPSAAGKERGLCRLRHAKLGWTMGLEPTTTGITTRGSTN